MVSQLCIESFEPGAHMLLKCGRRKSRRQFHQLIREQTMPRYLPLIQKGTVEFLQRLLDNPEEFIDHIHLYALCSDSSSSCLITP
jgi:hypothetical protein